MTHPEIHPDVSTFTRRQFMTATAAALGVALAGSHTARAAGTSARRLVTCRDPHLAQTGQPDCWTAMEALGLDGVECEVNEALSCPSLKNRKEPYALATDDDRKRLKADLAKHGKVISAFCMHNRLDERLEMEVEWARKLAQAATRMGVAVIRIDVYPHKLTGDAVLPFAVKACKQLCEAAQDTPVRFGIENHGKVTNDPVFLEQLFDAVSSPKLGLTLDFMNFYWWGHPLDQVYGIFEKFAPKAFHTHCKNLRYPADQRNAQRPMGWEYSKYAAPLYEGDIDYQRVGAILRKAGYTGDLCLENECLGHFPKEQQPGVLRKEVDLLRSLAG
jgi:sugar phosphate isomerase/epimerase